MVHIHSITRQELQLQPNLLSQESFEEARLKSQGMSANENSGATATNENFNFFYGRYSPPKLPTTSIITASGFPCFSFGQSSQNNNKNETFSFGTNYKGQNFDDRINSIQESITTIRNQPRCGFNDNATKTISERAQRIAMLEAAFSEVESLKTKVVSLEETIGTLLMDELDTMKSSVTSTVGLKKTPSIFDPPKLSSSLFNSSIAGALAKPFTFTPSINAISSSTPSTATFSFGSNVSTTATTNSQVITNEPATSQSSELVLALPTTTTAALPFTSTLPSSTSSSTSTFGTATISMPTTATPFFGSGISSILINASNATAFGSNVPGVFGATGVTTDTSSTLKRNNNGTEPTETEQEVEE